MNAAPVLNASPDLLLLPHRSGDRSALDVRRPDTMPHPRTASSITRIDLQPELRNSRTPIAEESDARDPFHHIRLIMLAEQERGNSFATQAGADGIARALARRPLNRVLIEAEFALPASAVWTECRTGRWVLRVGGAQMQGARASRHARRSLSARRAPLSTASSFG